MGVLFGQTGANPQTPSLRDQDLQDPRTAGPQDPRTSGPRDPRTSSSTQDAPKTTLMRIGIDLGGTKIEAVAMDAEGVRARPACASPRPAHDYDATLARSRGSSRALEQRFGGTGVGGCRDAGHHLARRPAWSRTPTPPGSTAGRSIATWQRALGRPVRLANDANCFALSEATDGAAAGARRRLRRHPRHRSRRRPRGRRPPPRGRASHRRRMGPQPAARAADDERPGPRVLLRAQRVHRDVPVGPRLGGGHRPANRPALDADALARAARNGDADAGAAVARYVDRLARALATVINVVDPDVIVLGGGLSNLEALYTDVPAPGAARLLRRSAHAPGARAARRLERRARRGVVMVRLVVWGVH